MFDKQVIFQLVDNKYIDNKINVSFNVTDNNDYINYITLISNALKLNYKKYNNVITKLIINCHSNNNYTFSYNIFNYFSLNNNLTSISITGRLLNDNNFILLCSSLKNNTSLKFLDLAHNNISDITPLNVILKNNVITELDLTMNKITNIDNLGDYLKNNTSLKILNLYNNKITDFKNFFENLKYNKTLKKLNIQYNIHLYIYDYDNIPSSYVQNYRNNVNYINTYLQNNNSLQELYINNTHYINNMFQIAFMNGYTNSADNFLCSIKQQDNNNYNYNLNNYNYDLSNIFKTLEHNNSLKLLDLGCNVLNNNEYYSLCNMLKVNTSISSLYITNIVNKIKEFNHDCSKLFNVLKFNNYIQELKINIYKMNKKEIKNLSEMLKYNTSIKKLEIIKNNTSYKDWFIIYNSLEFNKNLKELHLCNNISPIDETDRRYELYLLCKCLYFNKSIKTLKIEDESLKNIDLIVDLLKYNHHIKDIFLFEFPRFYRINININVINDLKDKIKKLTIFNKTLYNDY